MKRAIPGLQVIVFVLFSSSGCQQNPENSIPEYNLANQMEICRVPLSSICDTIEYIPIESGNDLIGNFFGFSHAGGIYAIRSSYDIFLVDGSGKIIYRLNKTGSGPGEYRMVYSFALAWDRPEIVILDNSRRVIHIYDFHGNEVKRVVLNSTVNEIISLPGNRILLYSRDGTGNEKFSHAIITHDGDTLFSLKNKFFFNPQVVVRSPFEALFFSTGSSICFKEVMDDTLFVIGPGYRLHADAVFNTGDLRFSAEMRERLDYRAIMEGTGEPTISFQSLFGTPGYYLYSYRILNDPQSDQEIRYGISGKKTIQSVILDENGFINDLDGGLPFFPCLQIDTNYLVQVVDAYKFRSWLTGAYFTEFTGNDNLKQRFINMAENLNENNNPVLIRCRIKRQ